MQGFKAAVRILETGLPSNPLLRAHALSDSTCPGCPGKQDDGWNPARHVRREHGVERAAEEQAAEEQTSLSLSVSIEWGCGGRRRHAPHNGCRRRSARLRMSHTALSSCMRMRPPTPPALAALASRTTAAT